MQLRSSIDHQYQARSKDIGLDFYSEILFDLDAVTQASVKSSSASTPRSRELKALKIRKTESDNEYTESA